MGIVQRSIYGVKRFLHRYPSVYQLGYAAATFNVDKFGQFMSRKRYPSQFGGMWTDRDDFQAQLDCRDFSPERQNQMRKWRDDGFVVLPGAIPEIDIDALNARLADLPNSHPEGLQVTLPENSQGIPYDPEAIAVHASARIVDCYHHFAEARAILFAKPILGFLKDVLATDPILTQSLSFKYGSEQPLHQDTNFVIMTSPMKFVAAWIALEDVRPGSGALQYLPGSHRWGDFLFSGRFKHWDRERDGEEALDEWGAWLQREAEARRAKPEQFFAKKGDVFLWHSGLAHGGSRITQSAATRLSLVGHYCPVGVRPLYHFYKPGQRKIYTGDNCRYTTAYY